MRAAGTIDISDAVQPRVESLPTMVDWESSAGGPAALPRTGRLSFAYSGTEDDHLSGQACLALEPPESAPEWCVVAFRVWLSHARIACLAATALIPAS
jgi:hypothetical protein